MKLINGKQIAQRIYDEVTAKLEATKVKPEMSIILANANEASRVYVNLKKKQAEKLGITVSVYEYPETVTTDELIVKVKELNALAEIHGILIQLPLYPHLKTQTQEIVNAIAPEKDIDGLTQVNQDLLANGKTDVLISATVVAILECLAYTAGKPYSDEAITTITKGKCIVILNNSFLIGRPLASYLRSLKADVHIADSKTPNEEELVQNADILVAATGKIGLINAKIIKPGAIVIDVTSKKTDKGVKGDVVQDETLEQTASWYTPVPGGVGPATIACLIRNLLYAQSKNRT